MEIEVKYKLKKFPKRSFLGEGMEIEQGYLPGGDIRLRKVGSIHFMTVKGPGDICREEWEVSIPQWVFKKLWVQTKGRRIKKTRYHVSFEGRIIELDKFLGRLKGLFILECEFSRFEDVKNFKLPYFACPATDVSKKKEYSNRSLAIYGLPKGWKKL